MEQPEDAYPLVRMPRQVVAAVRARNKRVPDHQLRDQFYRVQKDVLFLFHLHCQVNEHAFETEEARQLRFQLLGERLRTIIFRIYGVDRDRLEDFTLPRDLRSSRRRKKTQEETALDNDICDWPLEETLLWAEVASLKEAERIIAVRYLAGESLFFPRRCERWIRWIGRWTVYMRSMNRCLTAGPRTPTRTSPAGCRAQSSRGSHNPGHQTRLMSSCDHIRVESPGVLPSAL
jgi:hypothetical protein